VRTRRRAGEADLPIARMAPETVADNESHLDGEESERRTVVRSRRGSGTVRVEADSRIPEGMVWLPIHHPSVNDLTLPETDPRSDEPNYKQCAVRLVAPADPIGRAVAVRGD
jgi:assimilatory nitrate reductase catalytic subunit